LLTLRLPAAALCRRILILLVDSEYAYLLLLACRLAGPCQAA
jgi:hypothetical protein